MGNLWKLIIDSENSYFEDYLALIKSTIDEQTKNLDKEYKKFKDSKDLDEEVVYQGEEFFGEKYYEIERMEDLLYKSFVVSIFIFIEKRIIQLCNHLFKKNKEVFSHKDLSGNGVSRAITYLEKKLNQQFPKNANIRKDLHTAQIIRNAIVHNDAKINDNDKNYILKEINNGCHIKMDATTKEISMGYEYAKNMINLNEKICNEISDNWIVEETKIL